MQGKDPSCDVVLPGLGQSAEVGGWSGFAGFLAYKKTTNRGSESGVWAVLARCFCCGKVAFCRSQSSGAGLFYGPIKDLDGFGTR